MTFRLGKTVGWSAVALGAAGVTAAIAIAVGRAGMRDEIYAKLRDYEAAGALLSADLPAPTPATEAAARRFTDLLERRRFAPDLWDPPADAGLDRSEFENLAMNRVQTEELTRVERELLALWLASLEVDLASLRSLIGQPLPPLDAAGLSALTSEVMYASWAFSARAVLAAYEGDVNAAIDDLSAAFEVATLLDNLPGAYTFLSWLFCGGMAVERTERVLDLLPEGSDLSVLAKRIEGRSVDECLRRAFEDERVLYLAGLGLVQDGVIQPDADFVPRRQVLEDLRTFELLIEEGPQAIEPPRGAPSSNVQAIVVDAVNAANMHSAGIERLRARLVR